MRWFITICVLFCTPTVLFGAQPIPVKMHVEPPWEEADFAGDPREIARAVADLAAPDGDAEILLYEVTCRIDERHRLQTAVRTVYRCLNERSLSNWSSTQIAWAPWHQERPQIRIRVIGPDGESHELDPTTISESPVPATEPNVLTA